MLTLILTVTLIAFAVGGAELVRAACRRQLLATVPASMSRARADAPATAELDPAVVSG